MKKFQIIKKEKETGEEKTLKKEWYFRSDAEEMVEYLEERDEYGRFEFTINEYDDGETIADKEGSELRELLKIESCVDLSIEEFDKWFARHPGEDYYSANDRRKYLISQFLDAALSGVDTVDDEVQQIYNCIKTDEDRKVLADELIGCETYREVWDLIESTGYSVPEDYDGIDAYVYASRADFAADLKNVFLGEEDYNKFFTGDEE